MSFETFFELFDNSYFFFGFVLLQLIISLVLMLSVQMRQSKVKTNHHEYDTLNLTLNPGEPESDDHPESTEHESPITQALLGDKEKPPVYPPNTMNDHLDHLESLETTREAIIERVKKSLAKKDVLKTTDPEIIVTYSYDHSKSPHPNFDLWDINDNAANELYKFGIRLLYHYAGHKAPKEYLKIVADILKRVDHNVKAIKPRPYQDLYSALLNTVSNMLKLMAIYEFVADDDDVKRSICHALIIKLIPSLNFAIKASPNKTAEVDVMIPRLLSNLLFDEKVFEADKNSKQIENLHGYFAVKSKLPDGPIEKELFVDGSRIINDVASYSDLLHSVVNIEDTFNDDMYRALGFQSDYRKIVIETLRKLLHPKIKYHVVDLFGLFSHEIMDHAWWNVKPYATGVHTFPLMGIGVFKTDTRLFVIRVAKDRIKTFVNYKMILGLLQSRQIYEEGVDYEYMNWNPVIDAPGTITVDTSSARDGETDYEIGSSKSYIGQLIRKNVLFWSNKYEVSKPYKCAVWEVGVFSDGGLTSIYRIRNDDSRKLVFQNFVDGSKRFELVDPETTSVDYSLKAVIDESELATEVKFVTDVNYQMQFKFKNDVYDVNLIDDVSFIVKCNGVAILGGKCDGDLMDDISYEGKVFKRNSAFMYEP